MAWLLVLLTCIIGFSISSVALAQRGHARAVVLPLFAAWAFGMILFSLLGLDFTLRGRTFVERTFDELYGSLWIASALFGAALVTKRFQPGGDMLNTIFGAVAAGFAGVVAGTLFLALVSCSRGFGCI